MRPLSKLEAIVLAVATVIGTVVYCGALLFFSTVALFAVNFALRLEVPMLPVVLVVTLFVAVAIASLIRTILYERRVYVASAIAVLTLAVMQFERDLSILGEFFGYLGSAAYVLSLPLIAARFREPPPNKSLRSPPSSTK